MIYIYIYNIYKHIVTAVQWKQHQAVRSMSLYPSPQQRTEEKNNFCEEPRFVFNNNTMNNNNMFNTNNNNHHHNIFGLNDLPPQQRERDVLPPKRIKNDEFAVVLGNFIFADGLSFSITESNEYHRHNQALFEYFKLYGHLPPVPSRKIISGPLRDHIFQNQQTAIFEVIVIFIYFSRNFYVHNFYTVFKR